MAEYTYECELCHQRTTLNKPVRTPYFFPHKCKAHDDIGFNGFGNKNTRFDFIIDCGGACYRVWQPTPVYIKGLK